MRVKKLLSAAESRNIDAVLIATAENVTYYSGFFGTGSQLLISPHKRLLFTDFRYTEQAAEQTVFDVIETKGQTRIQTIFEYAARQKIKRIGIDLQGVSAPAYKFYLNHIKEDAIVDLSDDILFQRAIKDNYEIELIKKGAEHNDLLFNHLCGIIKEGVAERDIEAEIICYMHKKGAKCAFSPIVASGENSSMPHASPTARKLQRGDLLTLDYGFRFGGYCSDFTRTVAISHVDKEKQKVYDIVNRAGRKGIEALKPGVRASLVDAAARGYINSCGYQKHFGHGLGHGVGLFIHEAPVLNEFSDTMLEEGMVVTIEPGIYLEGRFGVRTEDLCLINKSGCVNLTAAPREITII